MGVFSGGNECNEAMAPMKMERCKRDYEAEIARVKNQQAASTRLARAVEEYIELNGRGNRDFTLTSLYGALLLEIRDQDRGIGNLQEQWEQDK